VGKPEEGEREEVAVFGPDRTQYEFD